MHKKGFTLVEIITALALIGVIAALVLSAFLVNAQQREFKTGLKKAVSILNNAISMNMAIGRKSPLENKDLYDYLSLEMSIMKEGVVPYKYYTDTKEGLTEGNNRAFYTLDGMRYEFGTTADKKNEGAKLHEADVYPCTSIVQDSTSSNSEKCNGCGSYGLPVNVRNSTKAPCLILVDINGDKKPTPGNINCEDEDCAKRYNVYRTAGANENRVKDIFNVLITDDRAIPYGVAAQRVMYDRHYKKTQK